MQKHTSLWEVQVFAKYLKYRYDLEPDFLECNSTNCGNNITNLLELLKENEISYNSIILSQDAVMQLRMGEILRLSDDEDGYGPNGKGFIAHVEIPMEVRNAFDVLCKEYAGLVRKANPLYASK